jgi:hypothetical protein
MLVHTCHSSYGETGKSEDYSPGKKQGPSSKTTRAKRAGGMPALGAQSPEFKPQYRSAYCLI